MKSMFARFISSVRDWFGIGIANQAADQAKVATRASTVIVDDLYPAPAPTRSRQPHANREVRRKLGVPHGVPGAKLARKAMAGKAGLAALR